VPRAASEQGRERGEDEEADEGGPEEQIIHTHL
jgi:hypothetical protein